MPASLPEDNAKKSTLHEQPHKAQVPHSPVYQTTCTTTNHYKAHTLNTRGCQKWQSVPWKQERWHLDRLHMLVPSDSYTCRAQVLFSGCIDAVMLWC